MSETSSSESKMKIVELNMEYLRKCYMNPVFSDVTLVVEGKEFPVVRYFLSMHSTFFEALFRGNFEDGHKKKLELEDVKLRPFEILLRFVYFGDVELKSTEKTVLLEILSLAHFFGMSAALHQIEDLVIKLPKVEDDVIEFANLAALYGLNKLLKPQFEYIFSHQKKFLEEEVFVKFNEAALLKLLDSDEWTIEEITIVDRVFYWLTINPTTNREELLKKLRLALVSAEILVRKVLPTQFFKDSEIFEALVESAKHPFKYYRNVFCCL